MTISKKLSISAAARFPASLFSNAFENKLAGSHFGRQIIEL